MEELTREEILRLAQRANKAKRAGVTAAELSEWLLDNHGITQDDLFLLLKALPPEEAAKSLSTGDLLRTGLRGATLGMAGGLEEGREAELQEMGHGGLLRRAKAFGAGTGAVAAAATAGVPAMLLRPGAASLPHLAQGTAATVGRRLSRRQLGKAMRSVQQAAREFSPSIGQTARGAYRAGKGALKNPLVRGGVGLYAADKLGLLDRILK